MKIFAINSVPYGSTAKIMLGIKNLAQANGHTVQMACGYSYHPISQLKGNYYQIGGAIGKQIHTILAKATGKNGCFSRLATRKLIKKIKEFNPDVIHLHNIHGWFLNVPMLFSFIKKEKIKVVWTLHDCWAFTGGCAHFYAVGCDKWKTGCYNCNNRKSYPSSIVDNTKKSYVQKKQWFTGVEDLTLVSPSKWLENIIKQSFLAPYKTTVINNGINLSVFKHSDSEFRKTYDIEDKFLVLGVSYGWGYKKGIDVFESISKKLGDKYKIVLVGVDEQIEKRLGENVICVKRTDSQQKLIDIYSCADVFVNPTREDNFPTVNIEALACGTPVITFDTGGSPEIIDSSCGSVVERNDVDGLVKEIIRVCENKVFSVHDCVARAKQFDENDRFKEYLSLFK